MSSNFLRLVLFGFFFFSLIGTVFLSSPEKVSAQTCLGERVCHKRDIQCSTPGCQPGFDPGCTCTDVGPNYVAACGGIPPICGGEPCLAGDTVLSETCSTGGGGGPVGPVCGNGTCQSGESCSSCSADCGFCPPCGGGPYDSCGGNQICCGAQVCVYYSTGQNAGCCPDSAPFFNGAQCLTSQGPTNTPTPTAVPCPGTCGTAALSGQSCGTGRLYSYNSVGDASCQQQSGNYYCWDCVNGPPAPPPPPATATPTTVAGSCPSGSHVDSSLCGGCCPNGQQCTAVAGGNHACQTSSGGGGGGGSCPNPDPTGTYWGGRVFYDSVVNNRYDAGEANRPFSGPILQSYIGCSPLGCVWGTAPRTDTDYANASGIFTPKVSVGGGTATINTSSFSSTEFGQPKGFDVITVWTEGQDGGGCDILSYTRTFTPGTSLTWPYTVTRADGTPGTNRVNIVLAAPYTISGNVYVDGNTNGQREIGEPLCSFGTLFCGLMGYTCSGGTCWDDDGDGTYEPGEAGYNGATVIRSLGASTTNATTNSSGNYSFLNVPSGGSQTLTLTVPTGYYATSTNPITANSTSTTNKNFGIAPIIEAGCTAGITRSVIGSLQYDALNNTCAFGSIPAGGVPIQLIEGGTSITIDSDTTTATGQYALYDDLGCQDRHIITVGESIKAIRPGGGSWQTTGFSGSDYGPFDYVSESETRDICLSNVRPWFQVTTGDVRFPNLINPVPTTTFGALGPTYPGIFISSDALVSNDNVSQQNWKVGDEYDFNRNFASGKGSMAYEFYEARAKERGQTVNPLATFSNTDLSNMSSGIYKIVGNTTISGATVNFGSATNQGKHIVLLVDGSVTINTEISIPSGQNTLFVLAAKNNITIGPDVGTTTFTSTTSNLAGFYSAQEDIILDTKQDCEDSEEDERLNVGGALIANALNPFSTSGGGELVNNRSLCALDVQNPTLYVSTRPDFLTQLTDFYKTVYKTFREIEP